MEVCTGSNKQTNWIQGYQQLRKFSKKESDWAVTMGDTCGYTLGENVSFGSK